MLRLTQQDPRWADLHINNTNSITKYHGCTITSICMIYSLLNPGKAYYPTEALSEWQFAGDLIDWRTKFKDMQFIKRVQGYDPDKVKKLVRDGYGVAVQVQTKSGAHWLAVWNWGYLNKPVCYDPFYGDVLYNPFGFLGRYVRPIGYVYFRKPIL